MGVLTVLRGGIVGVVVVRIIQGAVVKVIFIKMF